MIKSILVATAITVAPTTTFASSDDIVSFSSSAVCSELVGARYPSEVKDSDWQSYLTCIQAMHYFDTKY